MTSPRRDRYDAVIVGARAAGASTAMLLARSGLRVLAVERSPYGSDTLSTHALMRPGVLQLRRWGLLDALEAKGTPPMRETSFYYGQDDVNVVPIKERDGVDALYAPRRTVLDSMLVDAARDSGAEVVHRTTMTELHRSAFGRVNGVTVRTEDGKLRRIGADIVIGADGVRSKVAQLVGADRYRTTEHTTATIYGYFSDLDVDDYRWYFGSRVSAGTIPTNDGVLVFIGTPPDRFRSQLRFDLEAGFFEVLAECAPALVGPVMRAERAGPFRGFAGQVGYLRRSWGRGWALVGDAGYFKDPATAHGISDALRDAEMLARAVVRGGRGALAEYEATRDELSERLLEDTDAIASFDWDFQELEQLQRSLSKEMAREAKYLLSLDAGSSASAPAPLQTVASGRSLELAAQQ